MNRKTGDAGDRKDEKKKVKRQAGAGRPLLHGCISVNASTAADHKEEKTAKECDARVPTESEHACALHKKRIIDPSIAMQVRVPVRHAPVSMLIRLGLISGCGTGV